MVYRGRVTRVLDDSTIFVEISGMGTGGEYGPLYTGDHGLKQNDRVVVDPVNGIRDEIVYIGRGPGTITPVDKSSLVTANGVFTNITLTVHESYDVPLYDIRFKVGASGAGTVQGPVNLPVGLIGDDYRFLNGPDKPQPLSLVEGRMGTVSVNVKTGAIRLFAFAGANLANGDFLRAVGGLYV